MELPKDWTGPIFGALGTALAALIGYSGLQGVRRKKSETDLANKEDSIGGNYIDQIVADNVRLKNERDEAMQQVHVNYGLYVAEQRRADLNDLEIRRHEHRIEVLSEQVKLLTRTMVKYRPEEREQLGKSGFVDLDESDPPDQGTT